MSVGSSNATTPFLSWQALWQQQLQTNETGQGNPLSQLLSVLDQQATSSASFSATSSSISATSASGSSFPQFAPQVMQQLLALQTLAESTSSSPPASTSATGSTSASQQGSQPSAANGSSGTSVPSWVNNLQTASIRTDMAAADVNGTVTYAGLEKVIGDLDSTLTSSNSTLTAAEFSDLKTIAANLNNGVSTSQYLTTVMNNLVDGNAANATFTGGAATATPLGNLGVGSSATQLAELNDQWFLGTDLPRSNVAMCGYPTFSVSYSTDSAPLFGANGPSMNDVNQGYLGDCYFESSLAEV